MKQMYKKVMSKYVLEYTQQTDYRFNDSVSGLR